MYVSAKEGSRTTAPTIYENSAAVAVRQNDWFQSGSVAPDSPPLNNPTHDAGTGLAQASELLTRAGEIGGDRLSRLIPMLGAVASRPVDGLVLWLVARTAYLRGELVERALLSHVLRWALAPVIRDNRQQRGSSTRSLEKLWSRALTFALSSGPLPTWEGRMRWWSEQNLMEEGRKPSRPWSVFATRVGWQVCAAIQAILTRDARRFADALAYLHETCLRVLGRADLYHESRTPPGAPLPASSIWCEEVERARLALVAELADDLVSLVDHRSARVWLLLGVERARLARAISAEVEGAWDTAARQAEALALAVAWSEDASPGVEHIDQYALGLRLLTETRGCALEVHAAWAFGLTEHQLRERREAGDLFAFLARTAARKGGAT